MAHILIVDDDPAVQLTIRLILERAGHRVIVAGDGRKGLALVETNRFDLLCLDIFMPGMDGLETMRHIRVSSPGIPIIVMSGRLAAPESLAEPDFLAMATRLGAAASLRKPFGHRALLAAVDDCLNKTVGPNGLNVSAGSR